MLIAAFGRVKGPARDVELLLRAREQREALPSAPAFGAEPPREDLVAMPLWHAMEVARLAALVHSQPELDDEDVEAVRQRLQVHVAGVQVREAGETSAFKRRHRIGGDVQGAVDGYARVQDQLSKEALTEMDAVEARDDLVAFGHFMKTEFLSPWHIRLIASELMRLERREIKGLIVNVPPRHGKTMLTSHLFAAWYLGRHPDHDVIVGSMTTTFAEKKIGKPIRDIIQSSEFRRVFPGVNVALDSSAMGEFSMSRENVSSRERVGLFTAAGRGAPPTGSGSHLLILDDFIDELSAYSSTERAGLYDDIYGFRSRLAPNALWVVINTRYHDDDIVGVVQKKFKDRKWHTISLPVFAENDETHEIRHPKTTHTPASVEVVRRQKDEPLWPDRDPNWIEELKALRAATLAEDPQKWWGQYMCRPTPSTGGAVQMSWLRRYDWADAEDVAARSTRVVVSVDTGGVKLRERAGSARTAITVWAESEDGLSRLVDVEAGAWIYDDMVGKVKEVCDRWRPTDLLVEDKAAGVELIDDLAEADDWARTPVEAVTPTGSKELRLAAAAPLLRGGHVLIPAAGTFGDDQTPPRLVPEWLEDYVREMVTFPLGSRKDLVDSTSQYLNWRRQNPLSKYEPEPTSGARRDLYTALAGPWGASPPVQRHRGVAVRR